MNLTDFLAQKPLYYTTIDYKRMPDAYEAIKKFIKHPKIIHIVGTNGKGSTGRFLAQILRNLGLSVGHYTSPHIFEFNERVWINGKNVTDDALEDAHIYLQKILPGEFIKTLSYFEYTTFLAMILFSYECEYVILEAGLGGEHDATNVFPKILSIFVPIGLDHQDFLGESIEEIATTKLNSMASRAIISKQYIAQIYEIAKDIAFEKSSMLYFVDDCNLAFDKKFIKEVAQKNSLPHFQELNLQTALCASKVLGFESKIEIENLTFLQGRCQKITKNITVDVGHNKMAATAMVEHFKNKKVNLIYNSFKDKEYKDILDILSPIINKVELLHVENTREMATEDIRKICKDKNINTIDFKEIKKGEEYLVFGSFVVVESFMRRFCEG